MASFRFNCRAGMIKTYLLQMEYFLLILLLSITSIGGRSMQSNSNNTSELQYVKENQPERVTIRDDGEYAPQSVDDQLAAKIKNFLIHDYLKNDIAFMHKSDRKFQFYKIDLNGDGKNEIFIRFMTSYFCGTGGCSFLLLDDHFKVITYFSVTRAPIYAETTKVNGWAILLVKDQGVFKELKYENGTYPSNPSLLPKAPYDAPGGHAKIMFDDNFARAKTYEF